MARVAVIDPKTGDISIQSRQGDLTEFQRKSEAEDILAGKKIITDQREIEDLYRQSEQGGFNSAAGRQGILDKYGGYTPEQSALDAARKTVDEITKSQESRKPVYRSIPLNDGSGRNKTVRIGSPEDQAYTASRTQQDRFQPTLTQRQEAQQRPQPSIEGLKSTSRQSKLDAMRDMFNKAFESQKSEIESTRAGLTPRFRTERANIGTSDTMARARTEAIQAGQGLSGAGARSQSDIAQNVITQGALGQSRATEAEQNRLLDQAILQAAQQRDLGIAQGELQEAQLADERAYQQQLLNQQIAREDQLRREALAREDLLLGQQRQDTAQAQQRQDFLNTIGRFSADYQAEINRLQASNDPDKEFKIAILQQERQNKINQLGLDQQGNVLPQAPDTAATLELAQWKVRNNIPLNDLEAQVLGVRPGYTTPRTGGTVPTLSPSNISTNARYKISAGIPLNAQEAQLLGLPAGYVDPNFDSSVNVQPQFSDTEINRSVSNYVGDIQSQIENNDFGTFTTTNRNRAVADWLIQNADSITEEQGQSILQQYNMNLQDVQQRAIDAEAQRTGTLPPGQTMSPLGR